MTNVEVSPQLSPRPNKQKTKSKRVTNEKVSEKNLLHLLLQGIYLLFRILVANNVTKKKAEMMKAFKFPPFLSQEEFSNFFHSAPFEIFSRINLPICNFLAVKRDEMNNFL
jgi:hypothetical protein